MTFAELIQREHAAIAEALAHADVPHIQVIAELARLQNLLAFNAVPFQVGLALFALYFGLSQFLAEHRLDAWVQQNLLAFIAIFPAWSGLYSLCLSACPNSLLRTGVLPRGLF